MTAASARSLLGLTYVGRPSPGKAPTVEVYDHLGEYQLLVRRPGQSSPTIEAIFDRPDVASIVAALYRLAFTPHQDRTLTAIQALLGLEDPLQPAITRKLNRDEKRPSPNAKWRAGKCNTCFTDFLRFQTITQAKCPCGGSIRFRLHHRQDL